MDFKSSLFAGFVGMAASILLAPSLAWGTGQHNAHDYTVPTEAELKVPRLQFSELETISRTETLAQRSPIFGSRFFKTRNDTVAAYEASLPYSLQKREAQKLSAEFSLSYEATDTLDISLTPRAGIMRDGFKSSTSAGAELRLGEGLMRKGPAPKWYLFVGADGEALAWDAAGEGFSYAALALEDRITMGDIQAGLAFKLGEGQFSLGYLHREVSHFNERTRETISEDENYAALTFALKR